MKHLNDYEHKLLLGWEDVYKKSQLNLWILLALKDGSKHMAEMKQFITDITHDTVSADDKSMYRALRRYSDALLVSHQLRPSTSGPDLKVYHLTPTGTRVLAHFVERNITGVFYTPAVRKLIEKG